jgi:hypothetical protein
MFFVYYFIPRYLIAILGDKMALRKRGTRLRAGGELIGPTFPHGHPLLHPLGYPSPTHLIADIYEENDHASQ